MVGPHPGAFDAFAATYDDEFTASRLGQLLRWRVWAKLAHYFSPGQHILELACGTGVDALWLAQRGVHVLATDGSAEMVRVAAAKVAGEQRHGSIEVKQVSLQQIISLQSPISNLQSPISTLFDGVFSNFGGLNTISEWRPLAQTLAGVVQPGGKVILVPMGPLCPWEIAWYAVHGQFKTAVRRFRKPGAPAKIGQALIPIWYPAAARLRADFSPWFRHLSTESLGLWLPPSYLDHWVKRWPRLFDRLNRFEQKTARLSGGWGDHYIIVFERR
jgi:ubiquinone/menaquinone biosynthesis C-methylase UbiE